MQKGTIMNDVIKIGIDQPNKLFEIGRAMGSEIRIKILDALRQGSLNVNEIAEKLDIPLSTAAANIKVLEDVGLIITNYQPGVRGSMKLCGRRINEINIDLGTGGIINNENIVIQSMPVGAYTGCMVSPSCGLADDLGYITENLPNDFFLPQRIKAQILWFSKGYVEYKFSNTITPDKKVKSIEVSAELCSEAPKYRMNWPSDITLWLNGVVIGTWTSPGDFGGRRGKNNPEWWPDFNTQYGILKSWKITEKGSFIDENLVSNIKIKDLPGLDGDFINMKIGVMENAKNAGGVNIFGEKYGDYQQNIVLKIEF
jgi:predicted transcriptional regulator